MCRTQIRTHPFAKRSKKGVLYPHLKGVGPKPKREKFGPFKVPFGIPKVPNGLLDTECSSMFECILEFLSRVFLSGPCTQMCFHPQSMIFLSLFQIIQAFLGTIILQINILKQILIDFRLSTILLLSNHPFYSYACIPILNTNYQPITKLFN